jgi:hypothetical protein
LWYTHCLPHFRTLFACVFRLSSVLLPCLGLFFWRLKGVLQWVCESLVLIFYLISHISLKPLSLNLSLTFTIIRLLISKNRLLPSHSTNRGDKETKGKEKEEEEETKRKEEAKRKEEEEEVRRKEEEEEVRRKEEEAKRKEDAARGLFIISRLLNAILVSGAFQRHIRCLVKNKCLSIPMDMHQEHFRKFAETKDIPWQQSRKIQTEMFQSLRPEESDSISESEGTRSSREGDQDPFEINNDEDVIMAIQGWVKLFVQHLHAKSILESFARRGTRDISIDIKVYGVGPSQNPLPLPSWEDLEKIIRSSLQNKKIEEQDNMIEVFRSHFQTSSDNIAKDDNAAMAHSSRSSGKNPIFTVISDIITQKAKTRPRYYNIHCEAALAGLVSASMDPANALAPYADNDFIAELLVGLILSISHFSG